MVNDSKDGMIFEYCFKKTISKDGLHPTITMKEDSNQQYYEKERMNINK